MLKPRQTAAAPELDSLFVRIKPLDKKRGLIVERYTYKGIQFQEKKGWYAINNHDFARELEELHQVDGDESTPKLFDVCTRAEALALESKEKRKKGDKSTVEEADEKTPRSMRNTITTRDVLLKEGRQPGRDVSRMSRLYEDEEKQREKERAGVGVRGARNLLRKGASAARGVPREEELDEAPLHVDEESQHQEVVDPDEARREMLESEDVPQEEESDVLGQVKELGRVALDEPSPEVKELGAETDATSSPAKESATTPAKQKGGTAGGRTRGGAAKELRTS